VSERILVTGATGRHGGTGQELARLLIASRVQVRALVRTQDERAKALAAIGAEVVVGDFGDLESLKRALDGVTAASFNYPVNAGIVEAAARFAEAGRAAQLQRVVVNSMGPAHPHSPSPLGRAQWLAERVPGRAGFRCIFLRVMAFYLENLLLLHGESIRQESVIRNPFGAAKLNWIAAKDVSRLLARLLLEPDLAGAEELYPTGSASLSHLTHADIARELSTLLDREIRYEPVSVPVWRTELEALIPRREGVNPAMIEHIGALASAFSRPGARTAPPVSGDFARIVNEDPTTLAEFVSEHRARLMPALASTRLPSS
jgi:uncharacterized protein YbjT (DUF2867 family)